MQQQQNIDINSKVLKIEENVNSIKEDVTIIKTVLLGAPGQGGDSGMVKSFNELSKEVGRLKRQFWMLVAFMIGNGMISGGVITSLLLKG